MLNKILDFIFPIKCVYCGRFGKTICEKCLKKINMKYLFKKVNNDWFDYVFCGSFYKGLIRTQIHSFKFHEISYLYKYFIELSLRDKKIYKFLEDFDYIVYVPMYYKKEQRRGYNQAKLLAKELGEKLNIKVLDCLIKSKENIMQSSLSEKERITNVENVFEYIENNNINGKNIILVDDIVTTGSTVRSCSKILKKYGAKKICVFAIAKT